MGLISALLVPGVLLLLVLEASFHRLQPDAFDLPKELPGADMKEFEPSEPAWSSWVGVQVQWAASKLEAEKKEWRPWLYGFTLPVPTRPKKWDYWHNRHS